MGVLRAGFHGTVGQPSAQVIDGSLKFVGSRSNYLQRSQSGGNRRTFTWSGWIKPDGSYTGTSNNDWFTASEGDTTGGSDYGFGVRIYESSHGSYPDQLMVYEFENSAFKLRYISNKKFRDFSAFYHIVVAVDTTQTTDANKVRVYVNSEEITSWNTEVHPSTNLELTVNESGKNSQIGCAFENASTINQQCDGLATNFYLIDGQALTPESFGYTDPLTNTWRPKKYTGDFNVGTASLTVYPAPYSAAARFSSSADFGTVNNNATGAPSLPVGNNSHYGGKTIDLSSGGFKVTTVNSATTDFFMGMWVHFDTYETNRQFGINLNDNYVYFETGSGGAIKVRHKGDGGSTGSATNLDDGGWHHVALSRTGNTLYAFVDGTAVSSDSGGTSGVNTVLTNCDWWFWGGSGTSYNIDGQVFDPFVYIGQGVSSYTTPTNPLIDASGNINHFSGFSDTQAYYISPGVDVSGSSPNPVPNYFVTGTNSFYLPMDGNSPIGDDKSGAGNNWTPVNFGGSVALDNPQVSGARPILNTDGGGNVARPGVFGSELNQTIAVTVSNPGSGNKYYFDGVLSANPTLTRGATYTFDQSNSSNSSHPLRFATASDAAGSTQYTNGVTTNGTPGSAGAYTKITVPHNSADTLYYYCTNHSGMGSSTSQITDETKADPYAWKNVLALPLVGGSSDISNSVNSGSTTKTITSTNAVANYAFSNFYGGSWYFDGSGDYINASSNSDFTFGTGDFTIEGWVYPVTNNANKTVFSTNWGANGSILITFSHPSAGGAGKFGFFDYTSSNGSPKVTTSNAYSVNTWHHIAFVRNGTSHKFYINGIEDGSATYSASDLTRDVFIFGAVYTNGTETFDGYIQDSRIYKGVAKYTSNFVVPATSPDILPDTPSGVSGSSKLTKITDGAVSFDGGDSTNLAVPDSSDFDHASSFTWEGYFYLNAYDSTASAIVRHEDNGLDWYINTSGNIVFNQNTSTTLVLSGNGAFTLNKWVHIAVSHTGSVCKMFVDGIEKGSSTTTAVPDNVSGILYIGETGDSNTYQWNGFISNLRFVNGTALYTTDFTPPTRTLTNVTNTKLLCCQSNTSAGTAAVSPNLGGINDGTVWSSLGTGADNSPYRWEDTFDGNSSTYGAIAPQNSSLNLDLSGLPGGGLGYSSSVVIVVNRNSSAPDLLVNGVAQSITANGSDTTHTISGSGTLTSIGGQLRTAAGSGDMGIKSITVDGVALVDPVTANGNAAATNFNPFNTDINTVRGQETGYCTYSPLDKAASHTVSEGNLKVTCVNDANALTRGTIATPVDSGKWYWENELTLSVGAGFGAVRTDNSFDVALWTPSSGYGYYSEGPSYTRKISGGTQTSYGDSFVVGDTIGVALDLDNSEITFYKNGVSQGVAFSSLASGSYAPAFSSGTNSGTAACKSNFGQKPFRYSPPAGFQPLNAANVRPETVISRPDQFVGVTTYSGNQGTQSITMDNSALSPDFVWIKCRNDGIEHQLFDSVRGALKSLRSDNTSIEDTVANSLTSFDSNGFSLGSSQNVNHNKNYVAWTWKAGGNKGTFNIDDVGYASASDVGMNVGGLNSVTYNQTSTWSSGLTNSGITTPEYIFNGVLGSLGSNWATGTYAYSSVQNNGGTLSGLNLPTGTYRIRAYSNNAGAQIRINGGNYYTAPSGANVNEWWTITETTITSIEWIGGTTVYISGLECNGLLLVDNGISLNVPSIANTGCSVGTKQGFSIVKATLGTASGNVTIPHGLGKTPDFIIAKSLTNTYNWDIYHKDATPGGVNRLIFTTSGVDSQDPWGSVAPTSSVFTFSAGFYNDASDSVIYYSWADVPGLQKFGSYEGNSSADGPFVELGFKPAIIWLKNADDGTNRHWCIVDGTRTSFNKSASAEVLFADDSQVESYANDNYGQFGSKPCVDILSNGFKVREGDTSGVYTQTNRANTIIYCAWAEAPSFNLFGAQSNAF